jgi:hypothetical protein
MRGEIVEVLADHRYKVRLTVETASIDAARADLTARRAALITQRAAEQQRLDTFAAATVAAEQAANDALAAYQACMAAAGSDLNAIGACYSSNKDPMQRARASADQAAGVERMQRDVVRRLTLQIAAIDRRFGELDQIVADVQIVTLSAARCYGDDAAHSLAVGDPCSVIRTPLPDQRRVVLHPDDDTAPACLHDTRPFDSRLLLVDVALDPGVTRWQPRYRAGTIETKDPLTRTCSVRLAAAHAPIRLGVRHYDALPETVALNPAPTDGGDTYLCEGVTFAHCGYGSYALGDEVLLGFPDRDWATVQVLGWLTDPTCCSALLESGWLYQDANLVYRLSQGSAGPPPLVGACDGSNQRIVGQSSSGPACTSGSGAAVYWTGTADPPGDHAESTHDAAHSARVLLTGSYLDTQRYVGLARAACQAKNAAGRDIAEDLAAPGDSPGFNPDFFGVVRDLVIPAGDDPGRLVYWGVHIGSAGAFAWPLIPDPDGETYETYHQALITGTMAGVPITDAARFEYEQALLGVLISDPAASVTTLQAAADLLLDGASLSQVCAGCQFGAGNYSGVAVMYDVRHHADWHPQTNTSWQCYRCDLAISFDAQTGVPSMTHTWTNTRVWAPNMQFPLIGVDITTGKFCMWIGYEASPSRTATAEVHGWIGDDGAVVPVTATNYQSAAKNTSRQTNYTTAAACPGTCPEVSHEETWGSYAEVTGGWRVGSVDLSGTEDEGTMSMYSIGGSVAAGGTTYHAYGAPDCRDPSGNTQQSALYGIYEVYPALTLSLICNGASIPWTPYGHLEFKWQLASGGFERREWSRSRSVSQHRSAVIIGWARDAAIAARLLGSSDTYAGSGNWDWTTGAVATIQVKLMPGPYWQGYTPVWHGPHPYWVHGPNVGGSGLRPDGCTSGNAFGAVKVYEGERQAIAECGPNKNLTHIGDFHSYSGTQTDYDDDDPPAPKTQEQVEVTLVRSSGATQTLSGVSYDVVADWLGAFTISEPCVGRPGPHVIESAGAELFLADPSGDWTDNGGHNIVLPARPVGAR